MQVNASSHRGRDRDFDQLLASLRNMRTIVPVFATEFASARGQAARLRLENRKLIEQVRQLQHRHQDGDASGELLTSIASRTTPGRRLDRCAD